MFHNQLPKKWCIQRNPRNFEEVNNLFKKINGKTYKADGTWRTAGGSYRKQDYLCYPHYEGNKYRSKYQPSGYIEINLEQLKNYLMSKESQKIIDKLPEVWHVVKTPQNEEILSEWLRKSYPHHIGRLYNYVGEYKYKDNLSAIAIKGHSNQILDQEFTFGQEISMEDFRFHVLKQYTRKDWIEGRIAILKPYVKDSLLNTFLKECNPKNSILIYYNRSSETRYLVANMEERVMRGQGKGFWKPLSSTDLPIVEDVREILKNDHIMKNTKVIEYRVKEKFAKVSEALYSKFRIDSHGGYGRFDYKSVLREQYEDAGVLDIWFDEIEYVPKLPKINGYEGTIVGDCIQYGCASLSKDWFTNSGNRHIKELTLSSNVKITEEQMTEIRNYLKVS